MQKQNKIWQIIQNVLYGIAFMASLILVVLTMVFIGWLIANYWNVVCTGCLFVVIYFLGKAIKENFIDIVKSYRDNKNEKI